MPNNTNAIIASMFKTIVGAGMLALPFAYRQQGSVVAAAMIVVAAVTTAIGLGFQALSAGFLPKGQASFSAVCKITYPRLAIVFDSAIAIKCFGVAVSYLIIIGNLSPIIADYFRLTGLWLDNRLYITGALLIGSPFCFKRTLESLKYTSIVGLISAAYLILLVVGHYFAGDTLGEKGETHLFPLSAGSFFTSVPIILFSYTCAQNMYQALNELEDDSPREVTLLIGSCLGGACAIYLVVGSLGYLSFGDNVTDNIIAMYAQSPISTLGRFAMIVMVLFSYPLQMHPARASFLQIVTALSHTDFEAAPLLADDLEEEIDSPHPAEMDAKFVNQTTVFLLVASYIIAMSVKSLEVVLSFVGSIGATSISFILPGLFGYKLSAFDHPNRIFSITPLTRSLIRSVSIVLIVWGVITFSLGLGSNIYRLIK